MYTSVAGAIGYHQGVATSQATATAIFTDA